MLPLRLYLVLAAAILLTAGGFLILLALWWTSMVYPTSPLWPFLVESWHPALGRPFHVAGGFFGGLGLVLLVLAKRARPRPVEPPLHLKPPPRDPDF